MPFCSDFSSPSESVASHHDGLRQQSHSSKNLSKSLSESATLQFKSAVLILAQSKLYISSVQSMAHPTRMMFPSSYRSRQPASCLCICASLPPVAVLLHQLYMQFVFIPADSVIHKLPRVLLLTRFSPVLSHLTHTTTYQAKGLQRTTPPQVIGQSKTKLFSPLPARLLPLGNT